MPCEDCVVIFGLDHRCYRIPSIIKSRRGTLLAFAEDRGIDCSDDGDNHSLVLRRSHNDGRTWGPMIVVRNGTTPCNGCPAAISNPNPVDVLLPDGSNAILLHYTTLNNPGPVRHGHGMQLWSDDDGLSWRNASRIAYLPQPDLGAMVGPSVGLQDAHSGTVYFSAHLAYSYFSATSSWHASESDEVASRGPDEAFLYWSHDRGRSWQASQSVAGVNECSIALLSPRSPDGCSVAERVTGNASAKEASDVLMNCRPPCNVAGCDRHRVQLVWRDGRIASGPTHMDDLVDPGCQGSIISDDGIVFLSNLASAHERAGLTLRHSFDSGRTWQNGSTLIWAGPAAYSQLVALGDRSLGLLFEAGRTQPYEAIWYTTVPTSNLVPSWCLAPASPMFAADSADVSAPSIVSVPSIMAVTMVVVAVAMLLVLLFVRWSRQHTWPQSLRLVVVPLVILVAAFLGCTSTLQGGVNSALAIVLQAGSVANSTGSASGSPGCRCGEGVSALLVASFVSFSGGVICLVALNGIDAALHRGRPVRMRHPSHAWEITGGLVGCTVMLLTLMSLSVIGFALVSVVRAAGTAAASMAFDHVGCCGTPVRRMSARRLLGLGLLLIGIALSVAHELLDDFSSPRGGVMSLVLVSALPLLGGGLLPLQAVVNGQLAKSLGRPLRATLASFLGGASTLGLAVVACGPPHAALHTLAQDASWWMFSGGLLGLLGVTANFILPKYVGYATYAAFVTFGNLASSLAFDALGAFGFASRPPTLLRIAGVALALVGAQATRQSARDEDSKRLLEMADISGMRGVSASPANASVGADTDSPNTAHSSACVMPDETSG